MKKPKNPPGIFFHAWIFLYLQNSTTNVTVWKNRTLLCYYLLQLIFLNTSSRQIKDGYPVFIAADERDKQYSSREGMIFKTWRALPFLYEMNSIFNWICADTSLGEFLCLFFFFFFVFTIQYVIYVLHNISTYNSTYNSTYISTYISIFLAGYFLFLLDVFMWIQLDNLYATLLIVKYNMAYRERDRITLSGERPQPFIYKFLYGILIFSCLLLALVAPIMVFSTLSTPFSNFNPVVQADLSVSLQMTSMTHTTSTYLLYQSTSKAQLKTVDKSSDKSSYEYKCFATDLTLSSKYSKATGKMQTVQFPSSSDTTWRVTPTGLIHLGEWCCS